MDIAGEKAYPTPYINSAILPLLLLSLASQRHSPKPSRVVNKEYDYIIVGGGTSGSVVASRLSELPCVNVLLLEAGKDPPLLTEVPALSKFFRFTDIDWSYKTVPQRHTGEALVNKEVPLALGKVLGGSTVLNSVLFSRGSPFDYDDWAAEGADGWSFKQIVPYFKKLEDNQDPEYLRNGFHSEGGLLTIQRPRYQAEIKRPIFQAARTAGFKVVDPNSLKQTGFYDFQAPVRGGQRCSTAKSYLVPAENRTNLHVLPNAFVRKVIIQERDAVGVAYDHDGITHEVFARREVILAAGAINTAQILMLSGIGPKKELEKFEIPVWADLPVGVGLQDSCAVPLNFVINSSIPTVLEKLLNPANVDEYIKKKSGVLSSVDFISAVGYVNSKDSDQLTNTSISYQLTVSEEISLIPKHQYGLKNEIYSKIYGTYENKPYITCLSQPLRPKSRGVVRLRSSNPQDVPLIDPNYMEDPEDVRDIVEGLKTCQVLASTAAMRKLGTAQFQAVYPGCKQYKRNNDLYLWCLSKQVAISTNTPVGTAKMGDHRDPSTVLDAELRVKYLRRLRVVDASVMPTITSGDTRIPTIMIAEKASDIIKSSVNCDDEIAESDVQESMPVMSISPEILRRLPKPVPAERKPVSNSGLSQLKSVLSLLKQNKLPSPTRSSRKPESQIKQLVRALQDSTLNRRQEDTSSAALREVLRCLEEINQYIQQQNMQTAGVVYSDGLNSGTALAELAAILNSERQRNLFKGYSRQQGLNSEISTVLTQISTLLERLRDERDASATTTSDSVTSSDDGVMSQILTAISSLQGGEQAVTATDSSAEINQSALLNQILSAATGVLPGNPTSLQRQILPGETDISPGNVPGLLNQIWSSVNDIRQIDGLNQAVQSINNNTNRTENMMNEILTAVNDLRNSSSQRETAVSSTTSAPTTETPQDRMLNQILSTLNELRQNNQSVPVQNDTVAPSTTTENPNDATLRQIFSAINEMRESLTGVIRNTTNSDNNNVPQRNQTSADDSIRLLQQILELQQNRQNPQPVVETVVVQEEPTVVPATSIVPANPVMLPGIQPGINGLPIVPPGLQANPILGLLQRQRNLQLLSAMTGGNLPPGAFAPGMPIVSQQMMGMPPRFLPNQQQFLSPPLMVNRVPQVFPNQAPCQKTVILNNLNLCNGNDLNRRPMTANEMELCRSLQTGAECQNRNKCRSVSPVLYKYYCGKK